MTEEFDRLEHTIHYSFTDKSLILTALTHRSFGKSNNERLEFLGDSILGYLVAEKLFKRFISAPEGALSRVRSSLVNQTTLASVARELDLGRYLRLGAGEKKTGGDRDSILADTLEALIAAIYLDSDLENCRRVVEFLFEFRLQNNIGIAQQKDPKTQLQEFFQAKGHKLPKYSVVKVEGEAHKQIFYVQCRVEGFAEMDACAGNSKRSAEQAAAEEMLKSIEDAN